jgi:hypothetical protein
MSYARGPSTSAEGAPCRLAEFDGAGHGARTVRVDHHNVLSANLKRRARSGSDQSGFF